MLAMKLVPTGKESTGVILSGKRIVGSVSFAGNVMGNVSIHVSNAFARIMTAAMLSMDLEDVHGDEETHDVIGEVSNMVGGHLKSRLCDAGLSCDLSIPSVTSGSDFNIESMNWDEHHRLAFHYQQHIMVVEVHVK